MATLYIFKDPRDNAVRVVSDDPGPILEPLGFRRVRTHVPGGVFLQSIVRLLSVLPQDISGRQGDEVFLEVVIESVDLQDLATELNS